MEREEIKKQLQGAKKILVTISDFGRSKTYGGIFPYFNLYVEDQNDNISPIVYPNSGYWNHKKRSYGMNVYGTDRVFELLCSICEDYRFVNEIYKKVYNLW